MAINLRTVISELQYILELSVDSPKDPRLPALLQSAKDDLATAAKTIIGDDPLIQK
jgi:hypothetical protein